MRINSEFIDIDIDGKGGKGCATLLPYISARVSRSEV